MSDLESRKKAVVEFYELAFNAKQPQLAVEKYVGPQYIQHNPLAPDGAEAFVGFVTGYVGQFPELSVDIKRVVGEGDMVALHALIKTSADDPGLVAADFDSQWGRLSEPIALGQRERGEQPKKARW